MSKAYCCRDVTTSPTSVGASLDRFYGEGLIEREAVSRPLAEICHLSLTETGFPN